VHYGPSAEHISTRRRGGCVRRIFHRNEEIFREKIGVEVAKRRSVAQMFDGDPAIGIVRPRIVARRGGIGERKKASLQSASFA